MNLSTDICYQALLARDARYDGRFFTCVTSTGIYCRPICPAPAPKLDNCRFVSSAAAAQEAGFRPCLRCRPESAPDSPAWAGTSTTVKRALRLIDEGALDEGGLETLCDRLGVGARQLRRLFQRHVGAAPLAVAQTRRVLLAKQLLHETELPLADVALASGFRSVRRFNEVFLHLYGRAPGTLRGRRADLSRAAALTLRLPYRPPYDWPAILAFLARRTIPGLERIDGEGYHRVFRIGETAGSVSVKDVSADNALHASIRLPELSALPSVIARLRRLFDLQADPEAIRHGLGRDLALAPLVERRPGLRVPGGWDPFEVAVRAILGQQVSVDAATRLAGRLVERLGERVEGQAGIGLERLFPAPERFTFDEIKTLGMPSARAAALVALATAYRERPRLFDRRQDLDDTVAHLCALPGIGEWTAHYIAMRGLQESDAFLPSDVALQRVLAEQGRRPTPRELLARAEAWRPWRAYAVMHLWHADAATTTAAKPQQEKCNATLA
ncbi:helix-turn-helix domain-containing protein [Halomonas sp. LR3S48]|uniref:DNA-3-methyladenine glycosylase 2 family protein n=1 Tax=Halomonas sp. LR3S48 TaxID=2982694 RepID=UPI0021E4C0EF|nr:DNA-3-methyladenine glycosylase 2 family protein [Halomonas sp. LR3S48]UYG04663.1 helix-turn-helix domain-containing protein [Halomonas sp. LR3S48]